MVTLLAFLALGSTHRQVFSIVPTESVWVYSRASNPGGDEFLRVWGAGGIAVAESGGEDWSYGYLKWRLPTLPKTPLKKAVLIVQSLNPPPISELNALNNPLEVRPLLGIFSRKTWDYSQSTKVVPAGGKAKFGEGFPTAFAANPGPIKFEINLLKGPTSFDDYLSKSQDDLFLALATTINPSNGDDAQAGGLYKIYSAAAKEGNRPVLHLEY